MNIFKLFIPYNIFIVVSNIFCEIIRVALDMPLSWIRRRSIKLGEHKSSSTLMENFPREIVLDILSRLPVTSLLQFKLVCKAWYTLAQDPLLVSMQYNHTAENDPCLIIHSINPIQNHLYTLELSNNEEDKRVNKIRVPTLPEFDIIGSCKGLLCLRDSSTKDSLYVYNPFTGRYLDIPKSIDETLPNPDMVFGFGFNETTKEYKVVKVAYWMSRDGLFSFLFSLESEVQVFTLGKPGWRRLEKLDYKLADQGPSQVLVNGRLHWRNIRAKHHCYWLFSFDLEDEQFREVPIPIYSRDREFEVVKLGGCLGLVYRYYNQLEIWVMKEYGVEESWIEEYNILVDVPRGLEHSNENPIDPLRNSKWKRRVWHPWVVGLLKNGLVLLEYQCQALITYNQEDGTFKHLAFPGMPFWFETVVHEGSLSWIDTFIGET